MGKVKMVFKIGDTFRVRLMNHREDKKIHITNILKSCYKDQKLIVLKWYGKHKQWWHYELMYDFELEMYVKTTK